TDFGIARATNEVDMTEVGSIVGTAQYLSPEQARGQSVGPQTDIYSLGIVLYEMLTGEVPFTGASAVELAMKQVNDQPTPRSRRPVRGAAPCPGCWRCCSCLSPAWSASSSTSSSRAAPPRSPCRTSAGSPSSRPRCS